MAFLLNDLHCHSFLSSCYWDENMTPQTLLDFAESLIAADYREVVIDASLPAKPVYLKRGYAETEYHIIPTDEGHFLCYDVMRKTLP